MPYISHRKHVLQFILRMVPTAMQSNDAPFVHQTRPWCGLWPWKANAQTHRQRLVPHSRCKRSTPQPRMPNNCTPSYAADRLRTDRRQGLGQNPNHSRTRSPGRSRKTLAHGCDNVTANRDDATRERSRLAPAERAALSWLIAPVEPRWSSGPPTRSRQLQW